MWEPRARKKIADESATEATERVESHALPTHIQAVVSRTNSVKILAPIYADLRRRLGQQEENSFGCYELSRATLATFQCELEERRNRMIGIESATGKLSDHLAALRRQLYAPNPSHSSPFVVTEVRDCLDAPFVGVYEPLQNMGAVPASSATPYGPPNNHLYTQPPPPPDCAVPYSQRVCRFGYQPFSVHNILQFSSGSTQPRKFKPDILCLPP